MQVVLKKGGTHLHIEHQGNKVVRLTVCKDAKENEHLPPYTIDINRDELNKALDFVMGGCGCGCPVVTE